MIDTIPLHGGQLHTISERFGVPVLDLLDFSANINPEGPPDALLSSLRASLEDPSTLTEYPDLESAALKQSITTYADVPAGSIMVANGFVPLLQSVLRTIQIERCLLPVPAFLEYRRTLTQAGVDIETHRLNPDCNFSYELNALGDSLQWRGHGAVLLANPQNPSGVLTSRRSLLQLVTTCAEQNTIVLLDEAFIDYAPSESLTKYATEFPNLIVFRSVTKFHGCPGLRVAYAVASAPIAQAVNENLPPWPITTLASNAVVAALADQPFADQTRLQNDCRRSSLQAGIEDLGIHVYPSAANFLLFRLPQHLRADEFWGRMIIQHHIVLRNCSNYEALPSGHFRIAVRTEEQSQRLLTAMRQVLEDQ